jgi:hypothetical protein
MRTNKGASAPRSSMPRTIGKATTQGFESFASVIVNKQLKLRADYTLTDARDDITGLACYAGLQTRLVFQQSGRRSISYLSQQRFSMSARGPT